MHTFNKSQLSKTFILVGFMGAGKTSVGRNLAKILGWEFTDLDDLIVAAAGKPITAIFADHGEAEFRRREHEALSSVCRERRRKRVIALGGGAFAEQRNRELLDAAGLPIVFLDAPVEVLMERCGEGSTSRPLFHNQNQFRQLYEARRSSYMEADIRVETAGKTVVEVAAEVASRLGLAATHDASLDES